jgi:aerobic-type carbon monoxide dehydrogenase small subunit (CoxS/CutS family)
MARKHSICVKVNGVAHEREVEPRLLLSDFIRDELGLVGTHTGCEHGICGACTVLLDGQPIRSCLMFAVQANEGDLLTIEGLAREGKLQPIQEAFQEHHGLQCGYCTPGQVLTAHHFLSENPDPTPEQVRLGMSGVLCRCTGYKQIVDSVLAAAAALKEP